MTPSGYEHEWSTGWPVSDTRRVQWPDPRPGHRRTYTNRGHMMIPQTLWGHGGQKRMFTTPYENNNNNNIVAMIYYVMNFFFIRRLGGRPDGVNNGIKLNKCFIIFFSRTHRTSACSVDFFFKRISNYYTAGDSY